MYEREPDYYAILNLPPGSSIPLVQDQYRRLVMMFHPDRNGGDPWCEAQLKLFNAAYKALSDPDKKQEYDQRHEQRQSDALKFNGIFESAASQKSAGESLAETPSWSFTAQDTTRERAAAAGAGNGSTPGNVGPTWQTLFTDASFAPAPPKRPSQSAEQQKEKRSYTVQFAIAALAAIVFAGMFVATSYSEHQQESKPPTQIRKSGATHTAAHRASNSKPAKKAGPAPSVPTNSAITTQEMQHADQEIRKDALVEHERVLPYWSRFEHVSTKSNAAINRGKGLLSAMQAEDRRTVGGASSTRYARETKLSGDIKALGDKLQTTQSIFDDLHYESNPANLTSSLKMLDTQLKSLEQGNDPLYADLAAGR